jgi:uncharacterized protein
VLLLLSAFLLALACAFQLTHEILQPSHTAHRAIPEASMTRFAFTAVVLIVAMSGAARANGIQTIDCALDRSLAAERAICTSQRLQILDAKITEVYADVMLSRRVAFDIKARVREFQYQFLDRRNACGSNRGCLEEVMEQRLSRIHRDM